MQIITTTKSIAELGNIYEQVVGYDPTKDDPEITVKEILELMYGYDMDDTEKPFKKLNAYE